MKSVQKVRESLLSYLSQKEIQYAQVSRDELRDKAVVEFSFNLGASPFVLLGPFQDGIREIASVAHEAGHVILYKEMNREEMRTYLCTMFAAQGIGLDKVSPTGQEFILNIEAEASAKGFDILKEAGVSKEDLGPVKEFLCQFYASYEKLCHEYVATKVREKIIEDEDAAFLVPKQRMRSPERIHRAFDNMIT
jgi:hypothetical protein